MTKAEKIEAERKEKIRDKIVEKVLAEKACAECHIYPAIPHVDRNKPAVRHDWTLNKTNHFTMAHPYAKRTGGELCYFCEKIENNLIKPIAVR
jgi:hypothetical protein